MVDVSEKPVTTREAVARARVAMAPETLSLIESGRGPKGEVLGVARIAAIMAVKRTWELIPMCHPVSIREIGVNFRAEGPSSMRDPGSAESSTSAGGPASMGVFAPIESPASVESPAPAQGPTSPGRIAFLEIEVAVRAEDKTGVEMEALTGAAAGALTIYDMCKAVDRAMAIQDVRLIRKSGGRSGEFKREGEVSWE